MGMQTRRRILGDAHVDKAEAAKTDFDAPFQDLITEAAWGHVWSRGTWDERQRSIVTLALLCAGRNWDEVAMHIRATATTGASRDDMREILLHLAIYAGVPVANHAAKLAKQVYADMDQETKGTGAEEAGT